jgi:putative spermidine/putrescine transport system permease protein
MLGNDGTLNRFLLFTGLVTRPIQILFTPLAATIGMVHVLLPFMVLSLAGVLSGMDPSLEEAVLSLGADSMRVFWRLTVAPMIYDQITNIVDWSSGSAMSVMLLLAGLAVLLTVPLASRAARWL